MHWLQEKQKRQLPCLRLELLIKSMQQSHLYDLYRIFIPLVVISLNLSGWLRLQFEYLLLVNSAKIISIKSTVRGGKVILGTLSNTMSALLWIAFHLANRSHCAKLGSGVPGITLARHRNLSDMWHSLSTSARLSLSPLQWQKPRWNHR